MEQLKTTSKNHYKFVFEDENGEEVSIDKAIKAIEIVAYSDNDDCVDFDESSITFKLVESKWVIDEI